MRTIYTALLLMSLTTTAFADSDAQKTFARLKTLEGRWEGLMTTTPPVPNVDGTKTTVTFRVTSMGNTLVHEMTGVGRPDHPVTMFYLDEGRPALTHYCDAGNRPRMTGSMSADGKRVEYTFLDVAGSTEHGHMHGAAFTFVDADHHIEEWTFMMPGGKSVRARVELKRVK